jgi:hypothetical protein
MRRILAIAVLGGALFAGAACGGSDDGDDNGGTDPSPSAAGGASTEETCAALDEAMGEFTTELATAGVALATAADSGDEAAVEEAAAGLLVTAAETGDRLRDIAADAEDPQQRAAVEDIATEVENLAEAFTSDPGSLETLDTTGFDTAAEAVGEFCPTS